MKLLVYWFIVDFLGDFVSVECRIPSMSNLFRNRSSTTISPLTEIILQQQFSTTTINSLTLDSTSTDKSDDESLLFLPISHSTPASVKVIPAIVATVKSTSFDMPLRTNFNSSKVPVKLVIADAIIDSTSPPVVINKTANTTNGSVKYGMNNRDRMSNNVSRLTERLTVSRSANVSHVNMFPKRPLLSPTMSRYLAIAKEKALNSTPSPGLLIADSPTPTHIIAKRHAPLLSLDDFVLDIDNK